MTTKFHFEAPCNCGEKIEGVLLADTYRPDKTGGWFNLKSPVLCSICFLNVKTVHVPEGELYVLGINDVELDMEVWG